MELLFTMAIVGLVTALAVPNFRNFVQNNRAAEEANALVGALMLARSEAVTRGVPVSVCASDDSLTCADSDDWSTGWIVFTDNNAPLGQVDDDVDPPDTVLRALPALREGSTLDSTDPFINYTTAGFISDNAVVSFDLEIPYCTGNHNRTISINLQGRPTVASVACPGEL
jgi:type IV fimbrial biogenesis protein FimT